MDKLYRSTAEAIGNTPLLDAAKYAKDAGVDAMLLLKIEGMNPNGSVKDRVAKAMVDDAEKKGLLKEDGVIIEPTSGNTGIGLASIAAERGYRCIITMPDTMSVERRDLIAGYGADIVLTPGPQGMAGSIAKAKELAAEIPGAYMPGQFTNPANPEAHYRTTGPEIWEAADGKVDIFVAGVGTGGTITGVGRYLKEKNPSVRIYAVEPATSPVLEGGKPGPHKIQGIGAGFVPEVLDTSIYEEVIPVTNEEAFEGARRLARTEGILVGISAGAALSAAGKLAERDENRGKRIVAVMPDTGDRYLSMGLFTPEDPNKNKPKV